ncbi:hypothetical protein [Streptomyces sp. A1136]|nr:hypothetical protein [Streptomyces sp. A1136]
MNHEKVPRAYGRERGTTVGEGGDFRDPQRIRSLTRHLSGELTATN